MSSSGKLLKLLPLNLKQIKLLNMNRKLNAILLAALAAASFAYAARSERPNVLLILVDDLGYQDLSCQGATDIETPHIDRLAESGIRFTDGYVTAPQCGPSRAGLLTGMSQSRFWCMVKSNDQGLPAADVVELISEQLKAQGYTTGLIGKWHVGFVESEKEGHTTRAGHHPWERGFDYTLKHHGGMSHLFPYRQDGWKWMTSRRREPRLQQKLPSELAPNYIDGLSEDTYLTDVFSDKAEEFIKRNRDDPWFLYLSYNAPHTPCSAPEEKLEQFAAIQDPKRRMMAAMMSSLDDGVGQILAALKDSGQLENTLVWFLSDNGGPTAKNGSRNDPFSGLKGDVYEGGIRVPFIMSWPGTLPEGEVISEPVISLDILPTSLAAAGVEQVAEIHEGNNLLPWLTGQGDFPNEVLYWSWRSNNQAIRIGSLKEIRNGRPIPALDGSKLPKHNFVDLATNPTELAGKHSLKSPEKKQLLALRLDVWLEQLEADAKVLTPNLEKGKQK
jgi:arylsulfatase A-like enzyme